MRSQSLLNRTGLNTPGPVAALKAGRGCPMNRRGDLGAGRRLRGLPHSSGQSPALKSAPDTSRGGSRGRGSQAGPRPQTCTPWPGQLKRRQAAGSCTPPEPPSSTPRPAPLQVLVTLGGVTDTARSGCDRVLVQLKPHARGRVPPP